MNEHWHTVIIGGGQAGLAAGYFLKKMNIPFIILDEKENTGDSWRKRWDSLMLFTPSRYDSLPDLPFAGSNGSFPTKDQMADYLQSYAKKYSLPVKLNTKVTHLYFRDDSYEIETQSGNLSADNIVVATGTNPFPYIPDISKGLDPEIFQIHSSAYLNPGSVPAGDVLVVGAGTSGVEIALDISKTHKTFISGKPTFHIPDPVFKYAGGFYWWFISNVLTIKTPMGRKARKSIIRGGSPLIRVSSDDLDKAGIEQFPRLTGVKNGFPLFEDGRDIKVSAVIWATGYRPDFSWIEPDVTDETGWPYTHRGISSVCRGLYFVGMPFQFGLTSGLVGGVGRDAEFISKQILAS